MYLVEYNGMRMRSNLLISTLRRQKVIMNMCLT